MLGLRGLFLLFWTSAALCSVILYFEFDGHRANRWWISLIGGFSEVLAAFCRMYDISGVNLGYGRKPILGRFSLWLVRIFSAYLVISFILIVIIHGWPGINYFILPSMTVYYLLAAENDLKELYPKRSSGQKWSVKIQEWVVWCCDIILNRFGHSLARGVAVIFAIIGLINVLDRTDLALFSFLIAAVIYVGDQITTAIRESKGGDESKEGDD